MFHEVARNHLVNPGIIQGKAAVIPQGHPKAQQAYDVGGGNKQGPAPATHRGRTLDHSDIPSLPSRTGMVILRSLLEQIPGDRSRRIRLSRRGEDFPDDESIFIALKDRWTSSLPSRLKRLEFALPREIDMAEMDQYLSFFMQQFAHSLFCLAFLNCVFNTYRKGYSTLAACFLVGHSIA